jgi:hypothetical protein
MHLMETKTHHLITDVNGGEAICIYCNKTASELRRLHQTDQPTWFACPSYPE